MFVVSSGVDVSSSAIAAASGCGLRRASTAGRTGAHRLTDAADVGAVRTVGVNAGATGLGNETAAPSRPDGASAEPRDMSNITAAAAAVASATTTMPTVRPVRDIVSRCSAGSFAGLCGGARR